MGVALKLALLAAVLLVLPGCPAEEVPAVERGRELMFDSDVSPSGLNHFACATCHVVDSTPARLRYAGYSLLGVAKRRTFYGGAEDRLLDAVNFCIVQYMRGVALTETDPDGRAIYEYLLSISPGDPVDGIPWTLVHSIPELEGGGDAANGKRVYDAMCLECHGALHSGKGRREPKATILPDEAMEIYRTMFPGVKPRTIVTEKLRHGGFFGIGGQMPPNGAEVLSDAEILDLFAYIGF